MSKKKGPTSDDYFYMNPGNDGGCSFCLLNLSLLLAAPVAVVALIAKRTRARVHTGGAA